MHECAKVTTLQNTTLKNHQDPRKTVISIVTANATIHKTLLETLEKA